MKLILNTGPVGDHTEISLPNDLLWVDEFSWVAQSQAKSYTLPGALIIEVALKQAGRPITLESPAEMAWVTRGTLLQLIALANLLDRNFTLLLEYPTDTRSFLVKFDHTSGDTITAKPVKDFPGHDQSDWFTLKLKLIEV